MPAARIAPMLAVSDPAAAIAFYQRAFGATVLWQIGEPAEVAGLEVDGAEFFLAREQPTNPRSPDKVGFTTCRIELFVDDPETTLARAVAAGATSRDPVRERIHELVGPGPSKLRMLQGGLADPFGHTWLVGKFLD